MCRPMASLALQPKMISACLFQLVIIPWASMVITASSAVSMINRVFSSDSPQILLGLLQILNVGGCADKSKNFSFRVT